MKHKIIGGRRARGRREWNMTQKKQKVTRGQTIMAQCYECMGGYADGAQDCECTYCPLYSYHPYRR